MGSSIPTVRQTLLTLLQGLSLGEMTVVPVGILDPNGYANRVTVEGATEIDREWYFGEKRGHETYTIPVRVEVVRNGSDVMSASTRMWEIMTLVEQAILNSPGLGGLCSSIKPDGIPDGEVIGQVDNERIVAMATLRVEVLAVATFA